MYWELNSGAFDHTGPTPLRHFHGLICGPAVTGPRMSWLKIVSRAPWWRPLMATTLFAPSFRPLSRARYWPFGRTANCEVTFLPLSVTFAPAGVTRTRTSPPDTRSARFDTVLIVAA